MERRNFHFSTDPMIQRKAFRTDDTDEEWQFVANPPISLLIIIDVQIY